MAARRSFALIGASIALAGCTAVRTALPLPPQAPAVPTRTMPAGLQRHAIIGFSIDTPQRAATASREGITSTILYGGSPPPQSALAKALSSHGIDIIDGGISGLLFYWECHRTHTVKPPPKSYSYNPYCRTDEDPQMDSEAVVLQHADAIFRQDANRDYVAGYWVLDDWPFWDPGSGRELLRKVHTLITARTPGRPAVCGFGAGIGKPGQVFWDRGTAANYSNGGCDIVGWYNYSSFGRRHPSLGKDLDWTMKALLPAMAHSLERKGWHIGRTPLYGIGQGWGGSYDHRFYQPGLTRWEILDQAKAFCAFGATYVGWYAWDDSGFESRTRTPNDSAAIANGIDDGIGACRQIWKE